MRLPVDELDTAPNGSPTVVHQAERVEDPMAYLSFGVAAVQGVVAASGWSRVSRIVGIGGGFVSVIVVLLATALVP